MSIYPKLRFRVILCNIKMEIAEEKFDELKQFLEDSKKDRFQQLLDNREEPEIMGGILKRIIEILYNEKSVITDKLK